MANTLTSLIPDLYESLDVVSRELVGFIPSVTLDANIDRAAVGQNVRSFVTPAVSAENITPGQLPPDDGDQSIGNVPVVITQSRAVPFRWTGEEQRGVNTGAGYRNIRQDQMKQAMRTLCNEIEAYVAGTFVSASRATGTAGTTPFASDLGAAADARRILDDNGAPPSERAFIINTVAGAQMRKLTQLTKANEAGTVEFREQGTLLDVFGFRFRESAGVQRHTPGTGASYVTNGATAQGATSVAVQTGTGTILAGDVLTFAADADGTHKYVVGGALTAGSLTLNNPGIVTAGGIPSGNAVTVAGAYTANMAFSRNAIVLATRLPAVPEEGDMADDAVQIQDPRSGLAFEVRMYRQYRRVRYEIGIAYGWAMVKSEHCALVLG